MVKSIKRCVGLALAWSALLVQPAVRTERHSLEAGSSRESSDCADGWLLRIREDVMGRWRHEERWYRPFEPDDSLGLGEACWKTSSQGLKDLVLEHLFSRLGTTNRYFVEIGFNGASAEASNTFVLWESGWTGLRLDGSHANASINLQRERISPDNVKDILIKHEVPDSPDYISIDLDSFDIWIFQALLAQGSSSSGFRPRVVSMKYNPDFGWSLDTQLAFPDPTWGGASSTSWDEKSCFMGSSASALVAAARELGYEPVHREAAFDIFFIRADLISGCRTPTFGQGSLSRPHKCGKAEMDLLNCNADHEPGGACPLHMPMPLLSATLLIDFAVWRRTSSVVEARRAAWAAIWTELRSSEHSACFQAVYQSFPSTPIGVVPPWPGVDLSEGDAGLVRVGGVVAGGDGGGRLSARGGGGEGGEEEGAAAWWDRGIRVLHLGFHAGLRREVEALACLLNITIDYEDFPSAGRDSHTKYNMDRAHAARIWRAHGERWRQGYDGEPYASKKSLPLWAAVKSSC